MEWTNFHATILGQSFVKVLGRAEQGSLAFVRCLTSDIVEALAKDMDFEPLNWKVLRVADADNDSARTITADRAVEMREAKAAALLLLVDTARAGAGMDGIYSAAREVDEASLFGEALRLARREVTRQLSSQHRDYADRAIKKARGYGRRFSVSPWTEFDFLIRIAKERKHPGELLHLLGLWPVMETKGNKTDGLDISRMFVDRLLGPTVAGLTIARRIDTLKLRQPSEQQRSDLERYLREAASKPLIPALMELEDQKHLWVNSLQLEGSAQDIQAIELLPWRTRTGNIVKWSGLREEGPPESPPVLILKPDAERTGDYSKLEVKWKARPDNLDKGAVVYRVTILTDMDEELAVRELQHSARNEEKCRFSNDDFATLSEDALISAKIVVSVISSDAVEPQESEEFVIRFGDPPEHEHGGIGRKVRTFSEGLIELEDRETVAAIASSTDILPVDSKGFVLLRTAQRGKSFRVFRPSLLHEVEVQWSEHSGQIGRWRVKVRTSGARAAAAEFIPFERTNFAAGSLGDSPWDRTINASRRMSERFAACGGGVGQVYDENSRAFETVVKEYLLAWAALLDGGEPMLALANTVEIQSLSGRTIGLIVLPSHPQRVAWHVAYDNLVLHAAFEQGLTPKEIREELAILDGSMFPAFLPGLDGKSSFVFADTLGFHSVGMVLDTDKEPKAAIALLARALGESETADTSPTMGKQSAQVLGAEIIKYLECHNTSRLLHVHALRPGDGLTVARSLGCVHESYRKIVSDEDESGEVSPQGSPSFVLELYPSEEQRGVAGRFIAEAREKRRSGAGVLPAGDHWMLESLTLPGGVNLPRLRWARKSGQNPSTAAHLAVAFDTFESLVVPADKEQPDKCRPLYAFGLMSFFEREYSSLTYPLWRSIVPQSNEGEKHPADRTHSERLARIQQAIQKCVVRSLNTQGDLPMLRTEISYENTQNLQILHSLCDWVITLDRNAGIEYFDSPADNREIYDAYVIDCVPEREDLGCLQLITSTSNLDEVRGLLDSSLDQMGLSRSRRNAEFLLENLKALSGRLAIRLTGQKAPTSELIALAMCQANCRQAQEGSECWTQFESGFFIPVDDVRDLLPPLTALGEDGIDAKETRPDLIHVSIAPRKGLLFRFIEVKYRRHLRTARNPEELQHIRQQTESLRERWEKWYSHDICSPFRAVRRAKLARVLRFYADKARRHSDGEHTKGLSAETYEALIVEIDHMIEKGGDYSFAEVANGDRGWIFCPEYAGTKPLKISPSEWNTNIFLFGPGLLPDSNFRFEPTAVSPTVISETLCVRTSTDEEREPDVNTFPDITKHDEHIIVTTNEGGIADQQQEAHSENTCKDLSPTVCFGTDVLTGAKVQWQLTIKGNPHLLIAGLPGMGKTTCLLNLCKQMLDKEIKPIIFSYHQDIDERLQKMVPSIRFIDYHGLGFNPMQVMKRDSRLAYLDVAGSLRDIFVAIFPELGDIQGEHIRRAIKDSFVELGWDNLNADLSELHEPEFKRFTEILKASPKPDRGLQTLNARLEELGDYGFFDSGESIESLWESEEPIVIRIHTTQSDSLQKAFASLIFYGLYKNMFRRGIQDCITHAVIFDEAHRAAGLRLIPTMAKECRKYGISLVLASQEAKDFNVSVFSAIANYLVLKLTENDAKALVRNVASSQQERVLIDKIKQMEKFKAFYFCEGKSRPSTVMLLP